MVSFPQVSPPKPCAHLSLPPYVIKIFKKLNKKNHIPYLAIKFCLVGAKIGIKSLNAGEESQGCCLKGFEICRNLPVSLAYLENFTNHMKPKAPL